MNRTNKIFFHWLVELVNSSELDLKADFENLASLENWKLNECCTNGFCILKQWEVWVWKFSNTIEQSISCCCCWREQNGRGWRRATAPRCRPSASSWRTPGRWCPPRRWWIPSPPELVNADSLTAVQKKWRQNLERSSWWYFDGSLGSGLFCWRLLWPCWTCRMSRWSSRCASDDPQTRWTSFLRFLNRLLVLMHSERAGQK